MDFDIEKFSPTVAELQKLVDSAKDITLSDPKDQEQLENIKEKRIELRDARIKVQKYAKKVRRDAIDFQKAVIAKEKELVGIVSPEEERLKGLEDEAEQQRIRERRMKILPTRKEALKDKGLDVPEDDMLIDMDDDAFKGYVNEKLEEKNERERQELEREKQKLEEEKRAREREEQARKEERERIEREKQEEEERKAREKAEREKEERYQNWLEENEYNEETDITREQDGKVILYRKVSEYELE